MNVEEQTTASDNSKEVINHWKALVAKYSKSSRLRANWQLVNTLVPYGLTWYLMYLSLSVSWWLTIPLILLGAGLSVRTFIIFHDCGHGSFFKSRTANDVWGFLTGMLVFTPYYHWRWEHSIHHATNGDLDRRGVGDIWTLTVEEYLQASRWKKFSYRLARNPFILFVIAPIMLFAVFQRFPKASAKRRERYSVWSMNLAIVGMVGIMSNIFGLVPYLIIQGAIIAIASSAGVWLFYVQHQFDGGYWEHSEDWDFTKAALEGSSFYKLPKILQWFSGNIGYHHIHHLSPKIPNYNLERCHHSDPLFADVPATTLFSSLKALRYRLWDEKDRKLITFGQLRRKLKGQKKLEASSEHMGASKREQDRERETAAK